jgi:lipoic acid synthetase
MARTPDSSLDGTPPTRPARAAKPEWLKVKMPGGERYNSIKGRARELSLHTVCEEARCPNIGECFSSGTATFMILGDRCTRRCHFCNVETGRPRAVDPAEPEKLAETVTALGLRHVVITSVDRDDLKDLGAAHWAACIRAVKSIGATVEILTPDFGRARARAEEGSVDEALVDVVLAAAPDVWNHNMETVARLYKAVRPQSSWSVTTSLLRYVAQTGHPAVKSGIMVGLGEDDDEVKATLDTMAGLGVHIATIGQYLRPSLKHWAVARYVDDEAFAGYRAFGEARGFTHVFAGPFVRSSYHAREAHEAHAVSQQSAPASSRDLLRVLP